MVEQRRMPKECKPISNLEVKKIIQTFYAQKANLQMGMGDLTLNESGKELRKQTMDYLQDFNEFELDEQVRDIRK